MAGRNSEAREMRSPFSPAGSCLRLQRLQGLLREAHLDTLLLVGGTDGRDNEGARGVLTFLLEAGSPADVAPAGVRKLWLEDCVAVIKPESAELYCSRDAVQILLPGTALWPATTLQCPTEEETQDAEIEEDYKVRAFLRMVKGLQGKKIGVPLSPPKADPMEIESWPLIQAYGVEGYGPGGFFTMHHTVVDAGPVLETLYSQLDVPAIAHLLEHETVRVAQHWAELEALLDARSPSARNDLTELQLAEPLSTFFAHAALRGGPSQAKDTRMLPRVAFGVNSAGEKMQMTPGETTIAQGGIQGPALHFVVESSAPVWGLHCGRSYFLSNDGNDVMLLMHLYTALEEAAQAGMRHLAGSKEASTETARKVVIQSMEASLSSKLPPLSPLSPPAIAALKNVTISTWAVNSLTGQPTPPAWGDHRLKIVRLALPEIENVRGEALGGLVFAESYLEHGGEVLVVTDGVPPLAVWGGAGEEEERVRKERAELRDYLALHQVLGDGGSLELSRRRSSVSGGGSLGGARGALGAPLQEYEEPMRMTSDSRVLRSMDGTWMPFENGLVFSSLRLGPFWVDFSSGSVAAACIHREEGSHAPASVVFKFHQRSPFPLQTLSQQEDLLVAFDLLALPPGTRRQFTRQVLPVWQEAWQSHNISYGPTFPLPLAPSPLISAPNPGTPTLPLSFPPHKRFNVQTSDLDTAQFLQNSAISEAKRTGWPPLMKVGGGGVPIIVLSGTPGSGKEVLSRSLCSDSSKTWYVVSAKGPLALDAKMLKEDLEELENQLLKGTPPAPPHVLVLSPGLLPVPGVLSALADCPGVKESRFHVSCVTACVSAALFFDTSKRVQPAGGTLEQVTAGFVDNVILFDSTAVSTEELAVIRSTLHFSNPLARQIEASRSNLLELLEVASTPLEAPPINPHSPLPDLTAELACHLAYHPKALEPPPGYQSECIKCQGALEVDNLQWELAALFAGESVTEPLSPVKSPRVPIARPDVTYVLGFVRSAEGTVLEVSADRSSVAIAKYEPSRLPLVGGGHGLGFGGEGPVAELVFVGKTPLDVKGLQNLLLRCQPKLPRARLCKDESAVSEEEKVRLAKEHSNAPLPEGWFFDGVEYVDCFGDKSKYHPAMQEWVHEYVGKVNKEVQEYNARLEEERGRLGALCFA